MATTTSTVLGKVSAITGKAFLKLPNGQMRELKIGDVVREGDVIVVTGEGRVEIADESGAVYVPRTNEPLTVAGLEAGKPERVTVDEIERAITAVDQGGSEEDAPAAGLTADGAGSGLAPGLRVDRVNESVDGTEIEATAPAAGVEPAVVETGNGTAGDAADEADAVDTTPPAVSVAAPALTNDATPRLGGTTDLPDGSTVTLEVTDAAGAVHTFTTTVVGGAYSVDVPTPLADGGYTVRVTAQDAAGNTSTAAAAGTIDTTAPALTIDTPALTNDNRPTLSGTTALPDGSVVALAVTDASGAVQTLNATVSGGAYSVQVPVALVDGGYTVTATASDAAGNTANANDAGSIDTTAPALTIDAPTLTGDATPTISGTADLPNNSTVTITVTDSAGATQTLTATVTGGAYSVTVPIALAEGSFTVVASAADAAGNTATANDAGSLDTTAPILTVDAPALTNDSTPTITGTTDLP
ncbi:Ig-like domain-containing protein, partial [Schlegelella sp. S2-27]